MTHSTAQLLMWSLFITDLVGGLSLVLDVLLVTVMGADAELTPLTSGQRRLPLAMTSCCTLPELRIMSPILLEESNVGPFKLKSDTLPSLLPRASTPAPVPGIMWTAEAVRQNCPKEGDS